jgi:secreted trypsin-like serine protease
MGKEVNRTIALRAATLLLSGTALLANAAPAAAIVNGAPDEDNHPNVGLLAAVIPGEGLSAVCSGTLIAPRVFLTAGHCTGYLEALGVDWALVTFDAEASGGSQFYAGAIYTHPAFSSSQGDAADLGVVVLYRTPGGIEPAALPTEGLLDEMKASGFLNNGRFTAVGYGALGFVKTPDGKMAYTDFARRAATSGFTSINPTRLHLTQNAKKGFGGTCYGDSGGPNFIGDSNVIAGTTMTGDHYCHSTNVIYRLDTPTARSFLENFLTLP